MGYEEYDWLVRRAEGGFGLVVTCASRVQKNGQGFPGQLGNWDDRHLPGLTRLARGIHDGGSLAVMQLQHSGRRARPELTGLPLSCPWNDKDSGALAMTTAEIAHLVEDFALAARRAEEAGFDGVELHGAHGYLLAEFLDVDNNHRTDAYGGSAANRARIFHESVDAVRAATGPDFLLGVRLSPERFGIRLAEATALAEALMTGGEVDFLDMSLWDVFKRPEEEEFAGKLLIDWFTGLERGACRIGAAGKIMSTGAAQHCLDHGCDFVLIGRGAIIHHDFPQRALADADFHTRPIPLTREYLHGESVSDTFCDYIKGNWPEFIAD